MISLRTLLAAALVATASCAAAQDNSVCLGCHGNAGFEAPGPDGKPRALHVNPDRFAKSVHGPRNCTDCHTNITEIPHQKLLPRDEWRVKIPDVCGTCHSAQREIYATSVHGKAVLQDKNAYAATCSDCHTAHSVTPPSADPARLAITKNCGGCHSDKLASYTQTYHGQVHTLGYAYTAKCFDCHGNHGIQRVADPKSTVHPANRLQTCQKCHAGATAGFITFQPHANTHDFERYPQVWLATKLMIALLIGVFVFFWTHTALWFLREYLDRRQGKTRPHVATDNLQLQDRQFQRFAPGWRIAHLAFALSVMTLVLTGMTVFFPETDWAKSVAAAFGGPRNAALAHRVAAAIMLGIFFIHLLVVAFRIFAGRLRGFRWFGPISLVPNWQDLKDILAMFAWFFGRRPRPVFDRWTYWEKFDYWAVFWGMAIIGGSGMMLAFPVQAGAVLPGWMFNVATIVHGEEAVLAAVFLFTVHFFNNHFRPDKFPLDTVMFTGAVPLEEFRREHALEYQRLLASGELEKHLVQAPSRPMKVGSTILGFTLIGFGLTLLALVAIGFLGRL